MASSVKRPQPMDEDHCPPRDFKKGKFGVEEEEPSSDRHRHRHHQLGQPSSRVVLNPADCDLGTNSIHKFVESFFCGIENIIVFFCLDFWVCFFEILGINLLCVLFC